MKILLKGAVLGGFVAFLWVNISWMILPWHGHTISNLENEAPVAQALKEHVPKEGLYILPWSKDHSPEAYEKLNDKTEQGPYAFMVVLPQGFKKNMPQMMIFGLLSNIFIAFLLTLLLSKTKGLTYFQKVGFIKIAAVAGALVVIIPNLIWWQFPLKYTLVTIVDTAFTWGFAGLAIAKIVKD
jgi:hypothetical protein